MRRHGRRSGWLASGFGAAAICGCLQGATDAAPPTAGGVGLAARRDGRAWVGASGALALRLEGGVVTLAAGGAAPVTLETEGAAAGAAESLDGGRALVVHRAGVDERWDARDGAAEQSWVFARAPAGGLTVRVRVTGLRHAATDAEGLHLRDARTGAPWRYTHATWVDARGARTAVPAAWEDGAVVMRVPADVAARSAYPAVLDPTVGPEASLDPTVRPARLVTRTDFRPSAAFVGSSYAFAVQGNQGFHGSQAILLARVGADGAPLDPGAAWVDRYADEVSRPALFPATWGDGAGGALVTWLATGASPELWAARVEPSGALGPPALVDSGAAFNVNLADARWRYHLVADGGGFVGVLPVDAAASAYAVRRLRLDGAYAAGAPIATLGGALGAIARPQIAAAASGYLVAWQTSSGATGSDVRFARLSRAGAVLDPAGAALTVAAASRHDVRLATDGTRWLATWTADTGSGARAPGVYWVLLGPDGAPVGAAVNYAGAGALSAAAFNGANFLLAWRDGTFVNSARVSPAGVRLDAVAARWDMTRGGDVEVSAHGGEFLLSSNVGYLVARAVSSANVPLGAMSIAATYGMGDTRGSLCFDGTQYRATWTRHDNDGTVGDLLAARVSPAGVLLDAPATAAAPGGSTASFFGGTSACTRTSLLRTGEGWGNVLLTFGAGGAIASARTLPLGTPLATAPAPYGFLVLGSSLVGTNSTVAATRLGPDGAALDPFPIVLAGYANTTHDDTFAGALDFDGVNHAALWRPRLRSGTVSALRFTRISPEGDVLTPGGLEVTPPGIASDFSGGVSTPSMTAGPSQHLLVWTTGVRCGGGSCPVIRAARLSTAGVVLDAAALAITAPGGQGVHPAVATVWDGREYLVVWSDPRQNGNLRAARVLPDGGLPDPGGFAVTAAPGLRDLPMVASAGDGTALVGYRQYDPARAARRFFTRVVRPGDATPDGGVDAGGATDAGVIAVDVGVTPPVDAPAPDAGADAAPADTGPTGPTDAGVLDETAAVPDAAVPDAGPATPTDAAATDAGSPLPRDAGTDAGTDAGATTDAPAADPPDDGGSSCAASPRAPSAAGSSLAVFALGAALLRRRRARAPLPT